MIPRPASWKRKRKGESRASFLSGRGRSPRTRRWKELTLDLRWIKPEECSSLFKALASNKYLTKVTIDTFPDEQVAHICPGTAGHPRAGALLRRQTPPLRGTPLQCSRSARRFLGFAWKTGVPPKLSPCTPHFACFQRAIM
ncbi:hypothetical protein MRX96_021846 [Rhipicephalus microplus]